MKILPIGEEPSIAGVIGPVSTGEYPGSIPQTLQAVQSGCDSFVPGWEIAAILQDSNAIPTASSPACLTGYLMKILQNLLTLGFLCTIIEFLKALMNGSAPEANSENLAVSTEPASFKALPSSKTSAPASSGTVNSDGYAFPVAGVKPGTEIKTHWGSGERGGTDIFAPEGTPVFSICNGTVEKVGSGGAGGNSVTIKGDDGLTYYYAHLQEAPMVRTGERVRAGQQIGKVGDTGNAKGTGHHLHIGIGYGIQSGTGPHGGCGRNFDAVSFLQKILNAQK